MPKLLPRDSVKRLLILTHVPHVRHEGELFAYGPYVREVNVWCDLFGEVVIAAPCVDGSPDGDGLAFGRKNLSIYPLAECGGDTLFQKLARSYLLPWTIFRVCIAMWKADAIHVRCPGSLGLIGVVLGPIFSSNLVAKYAGQWNGYPGESRITRLQRWLLASRWWKGPVTVYGEWSNQPSHVKPFFTSVMTPEQVDRAKSIAYTRDQSTAFRVVFVGRLSTAKNVDVLLRAIANLRQEGIAVNGDIVGHGPQWESLVSLAEELGIADCTHFAGGVNFDRVFDFYEQSHVLVLASETEGWPKVIAEAMACGLVCVGSDRGLVPWMLADGRGRTVTPRDVEGLTNELRTIATSREIRKQMSEKAAAFGQRYSLDHLRDALTALLSESWSVDLPQAANQMLEKRSCAGAKDIAKMT